MSSLPLKLTSVDALDTVKPFQNLLNATALLCRDGRTFRVVDLFNFYYRATSKLKHDQRALYHIAQVYTRTIDQQDPNTAEDIQTLCLFFLRGVSAHIVEQSIRSMLRCLQINPFVLDVKHSFTSFLIDVNALKEIQHYNQNNEAIFRAAIIILMLNEVDLSSKQLTNLIYYINTTTDQPLMVVFAQYIGRHLEHGVFSYFNRETPFIENEMVVQLILNDIKHRSMMLRPYIQWDQHYMQQASLLELFFDRLAPELRSNKTLLLQIGGFYPDFTFGTDYIQPPSLRNDPDIKKMLQERHQILDK